MTWKERLRKIAPWVGFPLFYVFAFAIFAVLTFPFDKLKERIVTSFNAKQRETNGHDELQIGEMSGYWLTGVKMTDVRLLSASTDPSKPPSELHIDEARARMSILPLLVGNQDISFHLDAFGGTVDGSYDVHGKDKSIEVELEGVDLAHVEPIKGMLELPVEGKLDGTVKLSMPEGKASKANGSLALEAKDVSVGDGKAKLKGALALPKLTVGGLTLSAEAKDGTLKISKLAAGGKDLELQGDGRIAMRELAMESICDVQIRFKFNDGYRNKNDITKSLFGAPGSNAPALFELADPRVKQSKRPDGFYAWQLRGPLGRLDYQPAAGGGVPGGAAFPGGVPGGIPGMQMAPSMPGVPPRASQQ